MRRRPLKGSALEALHLTGDAGKRRPPRIRASQCGSRMPNCLLFRTMSVLGESAVPESSELVAQLLAGYRPLPHVYDEMMSDRGEVRAHWCDLLAGLAALGREELTRRFAATDRYVH